MGKLEEKRDGDVEGAFRCTSGVRRRERALIRNVKFISLLLTGASHRSLW